MMDRYRARSTWLKGYEALVNHDEAAARHHFLTAVRLDPGMADGWLGLHRTSETHEEATAALQALAQRLPRLGEERTRGEARLHSNYWVIPDFIHLPLNNADDVWCAVGAEQLRSDLLDRASESLRNVSAGHPVAAVLEGRIAILRGLNEDAIVLLRSVFGRGDVLEAYARMECAVLLKGAGAFEPAKDHLDFVLRQTSMPTLYAEAYWALGQIAAEQGDPVAANRYYQKGYDLNPKLDGLREAMQESAVHSADRRDAAGGREAAKKAPRPAASRATPADASKVPANEQESAESLEEVLAELDRQIGQEGIKRQVRTLLAQTRAQVARRARGLPPGRTTEHFVFTGPPGTGKTTVARIIARLYRALGLLEVGQVVEVDRSKLVGQYLGHTPALTQAAIDQAMGGVLFIDEAYTLQTDGFAHGDAFGREAIDTILKRMEDDRGQFVVIAAGYPEPMARFLDANPGLRSRFTTTIAFHSYDQQELLQIADVLATTTADVITDDARHALRKILAEMEQRGEFDSATFGNGRFIRNLLQKAAQQRDVRIFGAAGDEDPDAAALTELTGQDIVLAQRALSAPPQR